MTRSTSPLSFHHRSIAEGRMLAGPVPAAFEAFYRETLRWRPGRRVRSLDVAEQYAAWCARTGAASLNLRELKRAMLHIGHRHFRSNHTFYDDAQFVVEAPALPDNFPITPAEWPASNPGDRALVHQIDRTVGELHKLRAMVVAP